MNRNRRGMTLIELLIAMVMFMAFFILVTDCWPLNARASAQARSYGLASVLADELLETQRAKGYYNAASSSDTVTRSSRVNGNLVKTLFTYEISVSDVTTEMKDVVVNVHWIDEGRVERNVQYETLLCAR